MLKSVFKCLVLSSLFLLFQHPVYSQVKTLAVAPFKLIGDFEAPEIFSHGLPEAIANDLSRMPEISVVERLQLSAVIREHQLSQAGFISEQSAPRIGEMLGAEIVVVGTVQKIGNLVRVQSRAIEANSTEVIFSFKIEAKIKSIKDVFDLTDKIAKRMIMQFGLKLSENQLDDLKKAATPDETAFKLFSAGLKFYDDSHFQQGLACFKQAVELDKNFSLAQQIRLRAERAFEELDREIQH
ncbi:MAG: FlgO family outer membrane protein [bacterium]|nr:FlgO family outer membrane protein [bacterium]